ncbi:hypothetical protein [Nocardioides sp.]|uniref:hypothetical protein n=1 Tax=Nocardioides sp. TaxID=35761 RepID=UPI00261AB3D6|nr:hypothetical protein [Nocardioides sp.]
MLTTLLGGAGSAAYAGTFSSYRSTLTGITPSVAGVSVTVATDGEGITLTNTSDQPVIIKGYQGEPYVKVTSAGVWQNDLSPAVYLNKEQSIGSIPNDANATKAPRWTQISTNHRFTWHDHRIHWMGAAEPPAVAKDPGSKHLINDWKVPITIGSQEGTITGTLTYVPGSKWGTYLPYVAIGAGVIVVVGVQLLVVRRRRTVTPA